LILYGLVFLGFASLVICCGGFAAFNAQPPPEAEKPASIANEGQETPKTMEERIKEAKQKAQEERDAYAARERERERRVEEIRQRERA